MRLLLLPCRGHQRPVQKIMGDGLELDVGVEQRNLTVLYVSFSASEFSPKPTIKIEGQLTGETQFGSASVRDIRCHPKTWSG